MVGVGKETNSYILLQDETIFPAFAWNFIMKAGTRNKVNNFLLMHIYREKGTNSQKTDKLFTILAFWSVSIYPIILQTQPKDISPRKCMYTYRSGCDYSISYWSVRNNSLLNCQNLFDTLAANTGPISKGWYCKNHLLFILIVTFNSSVLKYYPIFKI